jgi:predicted dehydrogenase
MKRIQIGIVGCGEVTQIIHLPSLSYLADKFMVTALCDISNNVLNQVGNQWQISQRYLDYRDLLAKAEVDAILVASPDAYHSEIALAAIKAGKHLMIEKPMCITLNEADEIIAAKEQAQVTVQVGYMRRYAPAFVKACQLIDELGDIRLARVYDVLGRNPLFIKGTSRVVRGKDITDDIITAGRQLRDRSITEAIGDSPAELRIAYGLMLGLSSHDISAMRELLGIPQRVLYAAQRCGGIYLTAAFDYGRYICHYETGINNIPKFDAHLEIFGDEKILRVEYDTPYVRNLPIRLHIIESNSKGGVLQIAEHPEWGDAFVAEWQAFYDNVTGGLEPKTSPADFRQDLELFQHMIKAMKE